MVDLRSYLDDIARTDIRQVDGVERDPVRVSALIRALEGLSATRAHALPTINQASSPQGWIQ